MLALRHQKKLHSTGFFLTSISEGRFAGIFLRHRTTHSRNIFFSSLLEGKRCDYVVQWSKGDRQNGRIRFQYVTHHYQNLRSPKLFQNWLFQPQNMRRPHRHVWPLFTLSNARQCCQMRRIYTASRCMYTIQSPVCEVDMGFGPPFMHVSLTLKMSCRPYLAPAASSPPDHPVSQCLARLISRTFRWGISGEGSFQQKFQTPKR